jgi:transposase
MEKKVVYVGLDYHQKKVQVCAVNSEQQVLFNRPCDNDWRAIARAVVPLGSKVQAAIEACCGAADLAEELVSRARWSVDLAHPGYVNRMKQSPDKSDFSDARLLADLERVGYVPRVWQAPHYIVELRRLVKHRTALVKERRNLKLRIGALIRDQRILHAPARRWTRIWLGWLRADAPLSEESRWIIEEKLEQLTQVNKQIARAEARLENYTRDDPVVARLLEDRGIGLITACMLRASVGRFDRFRSGKQLARFCGTSPRNVSSGQRQATAGLIEACDRQLRATLIEAAHRLSRLDPYWRAFADRLLARGKPKNVVVAAVANRWLRRMYHTMKPLGLGF